MRLLDTSTLQLKEFVGKAPPYAILSHTWGDDEVLFQDFREDPTTKAGWGKVKASCDVARDLHHDWIWIDTCCIDKSSSAELSEAINSMFKWYEKAVVCLAYLSDIQFSDPETDPETDTFAEVLTGSWWFTRGWTLQELLAPRHLDFYSSEWKLLGSRSKFADAVSRKTGIENKFLCGRAGDRTRLSNASVAARMCWASGRRTTRIEDMAYCLLGLFDINMPLIYGEGNKAFKRLQEIIIREIDDQSTFAWGQGSNGHPSADMNLWGSPLLAGHPSWFKDSGDIVPFSPTDLTAPINVEVDGITLSTPLWMRKPTLSNSQSLPRGTKTNGVDRYSNMSVRLESWPEERAEHGNILVAPLKCRRDRDFFNCIAITLREIQQHRSSNRNNPSCHRVSHMNYSAPRSTWNSESICRPFIFFQSCYERQSSTPSPEAGCVIRSLPQDYRVHRRSTNPIISCDLNDKRFPTVVPIAGPVGELVLVLQSCAKRQGLSYASMSANIFIKPNNVQWRDVPKVISSSYAFYGIAQPHGALLTSGSVAQSELQPFEDFIVKISKESAYGPYIFIIDIEDPFGKTVTCETNQLGCFTLVRQCSFGSISDRPESSLSETSRTPFEKPNIRGFQFGGINEHN